MLTFEPDTMRHFDVVNRGFSGWNTENAIKYLEDIFPASTESSPKIKYIVRLGILFSWKIRGLTVISLYYWAPTMR